VGIHSASWQKIAGALRDLSLSWDLSQ